MKDFHTHLPALLEMVAKTTGPVLELGCGEGSTLILHEICWRMERELVSLDGSIDYVNQFAHLRNTCHKIAHVPNWDEHDFDADLPRVSGHRLQYEVCLVDHAPGERRRTDIGRLRLLFPRCIFVMHDAEIGADYIYGYRSLPMFCHTRLSTIVGLPSTLIASDREIP